MKKLVLSVALSLIGFSAINAAELKCDSRDAKIAFINAYFSLDITQEEANKFRQTGKLEFPHGEDIVHLSDKGVELMGPSGDSGGNIVGFKLSKNNKTNLICEAKNVDYVMFEGNEDDIRKTETKIRFTLQQDSKGNLIAKISK